MISNSKSYIPASDIESTNFPTDRKKKRRFAEIGSHSLRNLKKEFEHKDDTDTSKDKALT